MMVALSLLIPLLAYAALVLWLCHRHPEPNWDWSTIDCSDLRFPPDFLWGAATAAHQVEGGNDRNNWSRWEQQRDEKGRPRIEGDERAGEACQHYSRYPEDIRRLREELGLNSYRFSIEWSRLQPGPGQWDPEAVAHYHAVIDDCRARGVEPMVTLHHFSEPLWFADLGSFEKDENIAHIVDFARRAFAEYGGKVRWWCTFNEPGPFSVMGWLLGVFPPGKKQPALFGRVLRNLMVAHLRIYQAIKAMPGGSEAQVGLVKNIFQLDPSQRWSLLHWITCLVADELYNEGILRFLREGRFQLRVPGLVWIDEDWPEARGATDFLGLNYYANLILSPFSRQERPFVPILRPGQVATDMPYAIYAEGLWRALHRGATLGRPIIVTENGVADAADDGRRKLWIERYIYAMSRAMREGVDVRGFYYWSLLDNFEWAEGFAMRFGLYEMDYSTQARRLREGSRAYIDIVKRFSHG
jgi:beta-glucosidase